MELTQQAIEMHTRLSRITPQKRTLTINAITRFAMKEQLNAEYQSQIQKLGDFPAGEARALVELAMAVYGISPEAVQTVVRKS